MPERTLQLRFHGRVIDHLGIQMYQSPVAAIAELISNAWDADAEEVGVVLPAELSPDAAITITDDGVGMTLEECQARFLNVGYNRRGDNPSTKTAEKQRPLLGRKGIGKFASFGIATKLEISTVSKVTGEKTRFVLDLDRLRGEDDQYVTTEPTEIDVLEYLESDASRREGHGTTLTLRSLKLRRRPSVEQFALSMARRFLLLERADDFRVSINNEPLPSAAAVEGVEFEFPRDYTDEQRPPGLAVSDGWGRETLADGHQIKWRFVFYRETIGEEELQGVSVFSHGKIAQTPFLFNLTGGLGGQAGIAYLSGQVEADYIDEVATDLIATERQRIDWDAPEGLPLLEWGQSRVRELLRLWRDLRAQDKIQALEARVAPYAQRLGRLPTHERGVIERAIRNVAKISSLTAIEFGEMANAMLTAWEQGRLRDLIADLSGIDELDEQALLTLLVEANVLTALHVAESVKAQLLVIEGLRERVRNRELENPLRDYVAENPWLIGPKWSTFAKETGVNQVIGAAATAAGLDSDEDWRGRIDLVLSSGNQLLIVEFMRPGVVIDWDHVTRFERYVLEIRDRVAALTAADFTDVRGLLVADRLNRTGPLAAKIRELKTSRMDALDWDYLFNEAAAAWQAYFSLLVARAPDDDRLVALAAHGDETATAAQLHPDTNPPSP